NSFLSPAKLKLFFWHKRSAIPILDEKGLDALNTKVKNFLHISRDMSVLDFGFAFGRGGSLLGTPISVFQLDVMACKR
ncbi:hypothetical protein HAX54_003123, partial [Datura stramonium]|nr:hypothetical protein [Datura stramonium]